MTDHFLLKRSFIYYNMHPIFVASKKISDAPFYTTNSLLKEKSELVQLVSTQNIVQTLTIEGQCNAEQVRLCLHLFPRLQHITMKISRINAGAMYNMTFELLFSKMKDKTKHLFSICLVDERKATMRKLADLRQTKNWMTYFFSMKFIDNCVYIWW